LDGGEIFGGVVLIRFARIVTTSSPSVLLRSLGVALVDDTRLSYDEPLCTGWRDEINGHDIRTHMHDIRVEKRCLA
jgi:hypothetical protein